MSICPCGSKKTLATCCGPFINNTALPETPEELMRSRYTAYTLADIAYIKKTMVSPALDDFPAEEALKWAKRIDWVELEIIQSSIDGNEGKVEFVAHYNDGNDHCHLHEVSLFRRENNKWYYVDGEEPQAAVPYHKEIHIGRNDPCKCGSGKKYKKCCAT